MTVFLGLDRKTMENGDAMLVIRSFSSKIDKFISLCSLGNDEWIRDGRR